MIHALIQAHLGQQPPRLIEAASCDIQFVWQ